MKKLINILAICFLSLGGYAWADENNQKGSIKLFLSGGFVSPSLQTITHKDKPKESSEFTGYGALVDIKSKNGKHAFAVDYYSLGDSHKLDEDTFTEEFHGLLLGYRYHFNSGLYLGAGVMNLDSRISGPFTINGDLGRGTVIYELTPITALMFGYDYRFKNGFTIGVHIFNTRQEEDIKSKEFHPSDGVSPPRILDDSSYSISNLAFRAAGLNIGYSW